VRRCRWLAGPALAHKPSDSYLSITQTATALTGQWDIALRDLDFAIGLDADGNGEITWGEVRARHADIAAYALARLAVRADGQPCRCAPASSWSTAHRRRLHRAPAALNCPSPPAQLRSDLSLFADIDPQHRGCSTWRRRAGARGRARPAGADAEPSTCAQPSRWASSSTTREGVWHIWIGFDHILFLLSLLLPAVLAWRAARWQPAENFREAFVGRAEDRHRVHAWRTRSRCRWPRWACVSLPSRWVESAIAASVVLAALNNVWPLFHGRRWVVAFASA
jgi:hypothetical protein